jgi:hypothetical protein
MDLGVEVSRLRCATVWAAVTVAAAGLVALLLPVPAEAAAAARGGGWTGVGFESVLVWSCAAAAAAVTCWLWIVSTLVTLDAARGVRSSRRGVPAGLRTVLLGLCGAALTTGLAGPALASGDLAAQPQVLAGLRLPERVAVELPTSDPPAPAHTGDAPVIPTPHPAEAVVVGGGDTLWAIAAERLGAGATDAEVAAYWPAIYALNRDVIGREPGRIEPGQRLLLPPVARDGAAR